jgi:hypothetical protein
MKHSMIRKAATMVVALAVLATATTAMAQGSFRRIFAYQTQTFSAYVHAGVPAAVTIDGDGDTDLDLFVYDRFGRLVAVDDDSSDYCVVRWTPTSSGWVTVRLVNLGGVFNEYIIRTWAGLFN